MVWLITHIWLSIASAAVFGLILGWALRGIRFSGGARRAMVERDIALTELGQVRGELDSLYSAQRADPTGAVPESGQLQADLQARNARLKELEAELVASRQELQTVKADGEKKLLAAAAAAAAVTGAGAAVVTGGDASPATPERLDAGVNTGNAQIEWRNRYLESRVRSLETVVSDSANVAPVSEPAIDDQSERIAELEAGNTALQTQLTEISAELSKAKAAQTGGLVAGAAAGAGAMAVSQAASDDDPTDTVAIEKTRWQNDYLRQRVAFMEKHGISDRDGADLQPDVMPVEETPSPVHLAAVPDGAEAESASTDAGDIEQELARLRWRNRYLEGRLAYIDGDVTEEADAGAEQADDGDKTSAAEALLEQLKKSDGDGA